MVQVLSLPMTTSIANPIPYAKDCNPITAMLQLTSWIYFITFIETKFSFSQQSGFVLEHNFSTDPCIQPGDSIMFYFACHGSEIDPPKGWECSGPSNRIQVLVPRDYCSVTKQTILVSYLRLSDRRFNDLNFHSFGMFFIILDVLNFRGWQAFSHSYFTCQVMEWHMDPVWIWYFIQYQYWMQPHL